MVGKFCCTRPPPVEWRLPLFFGSPCRFSTSVGVVQFSFVFFWRAHACIFREGAGRFGCRGQGRPFGQKRAGLASCRASMRSVGVPAPRQLFCLHFSYEM